MINKSANKMFIAMVLLVILSALLEMMSHRFPHIYIVVLAISPIWGRLYWLAFAERDILPPKFHKCFACSTGGRFFCQRTTVTRKWHLKGEYVFWYECQWCGEEYKLYFTKNGEDLNVVQL